MALELLSDPLGVLVRGEADDDAALAAVVAEYPVPWAAHSGYPQHHWVVRPETSWRKVPAQWGGWNLCEARAGSRGSFTARLVQAEWDGAPMTASAAEGDGRG